MAGVCVGFVSALWIVRRTVVRGDFRARIRWEGCCGVGRESGDGETGSTRTITKKRLCVHEERKKSESDGFEITPTTVQHITLQYLPYQTRTRIIAARVSTFSATSNEPAAFSILRLDKRAKAYWTAE
jgi:hypothetical protein